MSTFRAALSLHISILVPIAMLSCSESVEDRSNPLTEKRTLDQASAISSEWRSSTSDETLQKQLSSLGYDPGTIDGVMGPKTRAAIMRFQRDRRLLPSGSVGPATTAYLMPASVQEVGTYLSRSEIRNGFLMRSSSYSYSGYLSPLKDDAGGYSLLSSFPSHLNPNGVDYGHPPGPQNRRRWR
jgi:hypothetical protein